MVTELPSLSNMESKITIDTHSVPTDGVSGGGGRGMNCDIAGNLKNSNLKMVDEHVHDSVENGKINGNFKESSKNGFPTKNKRKRRRGKPKQKTQTKPFKKSNWRFQMPPRYRNGGDDSSGPGGGGGGGGGVGVGGVVQVHSAPGRRRVMRSKLTRSRSIVPYNTNKFLMEEHMAELPVHLTPPGRTRDSSFSVDSEDNYFYSLPEDEEEFLTKEFANVYERARVERLEGMTKQQLIEECLQLEDRYGQDGGGGITQNGATELMNKIRALEERVRDLVAENLDLRRQVEYSQGSLMLDQQQMCENSSEDSESDSSSTSSSSSSSSCSSNNYSKSHHSSLSYDDNENNYMDNISRMDSDDFDSPQSCNGQYNVNSLVNNNEREYVLCDGDPLVGGYNQQQTTPNTATVTVDVGRVGGGSTVATSQQPSSPLRSSQTQRDINTVD